MKHFLAISFIISSGIIPASGAFTVLFGGGGVTPTSGADGAVYSYLQSVYGAANVDYVRTNDVATGVEAGYSVFVISSTPGSNTIRNKWHNSTTPIVNWEEAVVDNGAGEFSVSTGRTKEIETDHTVEITVDHEITAGFTVGQNVQVMSGSAELFWSTGAQAPGALSLAEDDDNAANDWLTIVDKGGLLLNGSPAPARRVMFGMTDSSFNAFTPAGQQLFGQAVQWAIPEPSYACLLGLGGLSLVAYRRRSARG